MADPRCLVELRVLDGPNVHMNGPAIQLRLDASPLLSEMPVATACQWLRDVARRMAESGGVRRLNVVVRPGFEPGELLVAFPWQRERRALKLAEWIAWAVDDVGELPLEETLRLAEDRLRHVAPGPRPTVLEPHVPVAAITGTNGKTTTTRLVAHLVTTAGLRTAWNSTDGVYGSETGLVEAGDWAGFEGARRVVETPGVQVGVIEAARGGILRRGLGVAHVDVGVVTNITADHLGEMGVETLADLAAVKATVVRAVRPGGWAVLNADDPHVLAMAGDCRGGVIAVGPDPDSTGMREAAARGYRLVTLGVAPIPAGCTHPADGLQGAPQVLLVDGGACQHVVPISEVPLTLAGLSAHNIANALAATAAAWGLGLPVKAMAEGLRTFLPDARHNAGRMNVYRRKGRLVIVDVAHNPDSLAALLDVARALTPEGKRLWTITGSLGDRSEEIMVEMGEIAGRMADQVLLAHKPRFLRGRDAHEVIELLQRGAAKAGVEDVPVFDDELDALDRVLADATPGDVIAFAVHHHLKDVASAMAERRCRPATPDEVAAWARRRHPAQSDVSGHVTPNEDRRAHETPLVGSRDPR